MNKKEKLLLTFLASILVVALIVVLGIMPNKTKLEESKKTLNTKEAEYNKVNTEKVQSIANYNIALKNRDESQIAYDEVSKRYNELPKFENDENWLYEVNSKFKEYNFNLIDTEYGVNSSNQLILVYELNYPYVINGEKYFTGYVLEDNDSQSDIAESINKLGQVESYKKLYYSLQQNNAATNELEASKFGGLRYNLQKLTKELNNKKGQIIISSIEKTSSIEVDVVVEDTQPVNPSTNPPDDTNQPGTNQPGTNPPNSGSGTQTQPVNTNNSPENDEINVIYLSTEKGQNATLKAVAEYVKSDFRILVRYVTYSQNINN